MFLQKNIIINILFFTLLFLTSCSDNKSFVEKGTLEALRDINEGNLKFKVYGELHPHEKIIGSSVKNKYNIKLIRVGGCVLEEGQREEWDAYNRVISKYAFEKWHLTDVLAEVIASKKDLMKTTDQ